MNHGSAGFTWSQAVHTSFWDGDLESFMYQSDKNWWRSAAP